MTVVQLANRYGISLLALLSVILYGAIAILSWQFEFHSTGSSRPIIAVLSIFAVAFVAYLASIRVANRQAADRNSLPLIIGAAVLFRIVMLFSLPIQEVDLYRYLWDGEVSSQGISPFAYTPLQVQQADAGAPSNESVQRLVSMLDREPAMAEALERVHFPELPTIYPATSQFVFAIASSTMPSQTSLLSRVFLIKAWLITFDIATIFVVIGLLRLCGRPPVLCIIYAWCPLLMKEVANSGHLDAIAVFLTTLSVYLLLRLYVGQSTRTLTTRSVNRQLLFISLVLALAVGAKLYPIVLAPLFVFTVASTFGWRYLLLPGTTFSIVLCMLLWPMIPSNKSDPSVTTVTNQSSSQETDLRAPDEYTDPQPRETDPSLGVKTFLKHWEMNDFIFMILIENMKPQAQFAPDRTAWFSVLPESVRQATVDFVTSRFMVEPSQVPFVTARAITGVLFLIVAMILSWRTIGIRDGRLLCETGFLTLAWFWLLCPTQNPWYWTWALPLLPFATGRAWIAVSGLVLVYYVRFWLNYQYPDSAVMGTRYSGLAFYDFIVTWIEFAPWFAWLGFDYIRRRSLNRFGVAGKHAVDALR